MENTKTNQSMEINEDVIYTVVKNTTKNQKVILASLGGIEIPPGATVNLREMFRKPQLVEAAQEIHHFIKYGALEDIGGKPVILSQAQNENIQEELKKKIADARIRELHNEIMGCTLLSRLEDILSDNNTPNEVKREAKVRYMQLRGWVDDNGVLLEGSADDSNQEIISIDSWDFAPMNLTK